MSVYSEGRFVQGVTRHCAHDAWHSMAPTLMRLGSRRAAIKHFGLVAWGPFLPARLCWVLVGVGLGLEWTTLFGTWLCNNYLATLRPWNALHRGSWLNNFLLLALVQGNYQLSRFTRPRAKHTYVLFETGEPLHGASTNAFGNGILFPLLVRKIEWAILTFDMDIDIYWARGRKIVIFTFEYCTEQCSPQSGSSVLCRA